MNKRLLSLALLASGTAALATPGLLRGEAPLETQRGYSIHSIDSAPEPTKEVLQWYVENFQFVPHLAGVMADAPALSRSYWQLQQNLTSMGSLTPPENNIVQLAVAVENECQYCVAGHTLAGKMYFQSSEEQLQALRMNAKLSEPKFNALRDFALQVMDSRGRVTAAQLKSFMDAGYTRQQSLDVVANVAAKVMSNYTNQIAETPIDDPMKPLAEGLPFKEDRKSVAR